MRSEDLDFFVQFPNIEIRYEKRLHAKYYANESYAILTSLNLLESSLNNIEVGIVTKVDSILKIGGDQIDIKAWEYFTERVIKDSILIYKTIPEFDNGFLGTGLNKVFKRPIVKENKLKDFFKSKNLQNSDYKIENKELIPSTPIKIISKNNSKENLGFCIKTRERIPFDINKPLSIDAWKVWNKNKNEFEPGKFCHYSGEQTYGYNTKKEPILKKYLDQAKSNFNI